MATLFFDDLIWMSHTEPPELNWEEKWQLWPQTTSSSGHQEGQLGKGSCNPLLVFQLKVLWYQDFTGTFIYESLHYITMLFSRTVSHIPRMCFSEIHVKINITMEGKNTLKKARKLDIVNKVWRISIESVTVEHCTSAISWQHRRVQTRVRLTSYAWLRPF